MYSDVISVAPMLDCTDRHFRFLMRLLTRKTLLYTEMHTIHEVLNTKNRRILELNAIEHPIALQLGGSDPELLAQCVTLANQSRFEEINLNVGCPSTRVQQGGIGACLMLNPNLVAECIAAMQAATQACISVKCRLGVDEVDSYEHLANFIQVVAEAGCQKFIIHARKAWLKGLNPRQNRQIPPLDYARVYQLKKDFPQLKIIINGGISQLEEVDSHLKQVDGVMLGRSIYKNPQWLSLVDHYYFGEETYDQSQISDRYITYIEQELQIGTRLWSITRHLLGIFHGKPGAKMWRKLVCTNNEIKDLGIIKKALDEALNAAMIG